jgi:hypothetical protein
MDNNYDGDCGDHRLPGHSHFRNARIFIATSTRHNFDLGCRHLGLLIGVVTWFLLAIAFPLSLGQGVPRVKAGFMLPSVYWGALVPAGVLGMIVGALFWFIAQPDRDHL